MMLTFLISAVNLGVPSFIRVMILRLHGEISVTVEQEYVYRFQLVVKLIRWHTWDLTQPVDTWYGITTDANGCVSRITLDEQDLTGTIPAWLGNLAYLTHLDLFGNDLTGPIPPQLGNLSNLLYMDLNYNELNGTIPVELSNLSNLRRLNLGSNQLTGTIPPQLGNLSSLTSLLLSGNQLSGSIPSELGNLSELVYLYLNHNDLIGTIPSELGNLINLSKLLLDNNQLTGEILASFGSLPDLTVLRVADNQLSGCYDDNLLNLCNQLSDYSNNNEIISDGNNFDTPWETFCSAGYCVQTKVAEEDNNYVLPYIGRVPLSTCHGRCGICH